MFHPSPTHRFALEQHDGAYETWPLQSRLIVDGVARDVAVPGYQLLHQFELPDGYFLVTDFDCPYEEATNFVLLSCGMDILAIRSLGAMYASFLLDKLSWINDRQLTATFYDHGHWRIRILHPDLPFMRWRISARRVQSALQGT
jgi:hypothetical protein